MNTASHTQMIWTAGELIVAALFMLIAVAWANHVEEKKRRRHWTRRK